MAPIAELLELRGGGNSSASKSGGGPAGYDALFDWVLQFRQRLNIPHSLAEIKVPLEDSEKIGHEASIDPSAGSNPVVLDAATYARVFRSAVKGDLKLGG
jgi:alcohol dehydrogenase class IV